jgi:hypothetical protein
MASLTASLLTYLVLLLSLLYVSDAFIIIARQNASAGTTVQIDDCTNYARIANLSTVASNTTYRAAWIRSAPMGTLMAASILDKETVQLPAVQLDSQLNKQCGNLATIAIQAAATNFTEGTVLGVPIQDDVGAPPDGFAMPFSWLLSTLLIAVLGASV